VTQTPHIRATPPMTAPCDPAIQSARQELLDSWYDQDGRQKPSHELHGLYTGLAEKYREQGSTPAG